MSDTELIKRFEELEAGRVLGDLSPEEVREWQDLSKDPRCKSDGSLELTAAAFETEFLAENNEKLPARLASELDRDMAAFVKDRPVGGVTIPVSGPPSWFTSAKLAWAIAAVFAILFVINSLQPPGPSNDLTNVAKSPTEARDLLVKDASDLVALDFSGLEAYEQMSGEVVWSDERQEGYMTLSGLPANDPAAKQYQLWIVDPARDERPVDGGVFDIAAGTGTAVVPIRNPLAVSNPQAFVITLEQPGGVVVSKQEVVVALAKAS